MRVSGGRLEPDDDISFFPFESLMFPVHLRMQVSTEPPSSEGAMNGVQGSQHNNRKDNYGCNCNPALHVPKGRCVEVRACAKDPIQVIPAGRAVSAGAEGGLAVHRGDAKWSCPD